MLPYVPELLFKYGIDFRKSNPFYYPVIYLQIRPVAAKIHAPGALEHYSVFKMVSFQIIPDIVDYIAVSPGEAGTTHAYVHFNLLRHPLC
jgi:hypothetical protein